jgi:hypothetical protein
MSKRAQQSGVCLYGIRGVCAFTGMIELPRQAPFDYMHLVLQGHGKWLLNRYFYFDRNADFNLGKLMFIVVNFKAFFFQIVSIF